MSNRLSLKSWAAWWKALGSRGKRIWLISAMLAALCVALVIASVNMLNAQEQEKALARQNTDALSLTAQTIASPTLSPVESAQITPIPAETPRPIVLQDVGGYEVIAKLFIAKLELTLPVIGQTTDEALKVSPCLFSGPVSPDDAGNMVITAHNNKDGSQFGLLKNLKTGDTVQLMNKWGDAFTYEVYDIETITPDDVAALEEYEGEKALSLLTCTSQGNKRLLLRCRMIDG